MSEGIVWALVGNNVSKYGQRLVTFLKTRGRNPEERALSQQASGAVLTITVLAALTCALFSWSAFSQALQESEAQKAPK